MRQGWMYPEDKLLSSRQNEPVEMIDCSVIDSETTDGNKKIELNFRGTNEKKKTIEFNDDDIGKWRIEFVTNSDSIILAPNKGDKSEAKPKNNDTSMVEPKDVNVDGVCTNEEVRQWLNKYIDTEHYEVYFFFAR